MTTWGVTTKRTPFVKTDKKPQDRKFRRKLAKQFDRQFPIYGTSRAGLHLWELRKTQSVTITRYNLAIRLPRRGDRNPPRPGYHWAPKIVVAF
jgi:hypothetical protein